MRASVAILLLSAAIPVSAGDISSVTAESVADPDNPTLFLARDVLERWERVLTEEGPGRMSASNICRMYLDAWATVDLDRAIELEQTYRCRSSQNLLAVRLAGAHRWDDVQAIIDADPEEFRYRAPKFWARVACYGASIGDLDIVDLAGRRVELIAAAEPSEPGRPPRPSERVALARFYVAASRLDVLRQQYERIAEFETEYVPGLEQRKALSVAMEDLWRAAGDVVPERAWYLTTPQVSSFQGLAALESWDIAPGVIGLVRPQQDNFVGDLLDHFRQEGTSSPRVRIGILPPDLSSSVTSAWLTRQMLLGRTSVALTTLWLAPGSDVDRARNLAIMSRYLPAEESALAATWREAADAVLGLVTDVDDSAVRALAELSLAYSSAGDFDNATRCIDATFGAYSADGKDERLWAEIEQMWVAKYPLLAFEDLAARRDDEVKPVWATEFETRQVLLQAAAALPDGHSRLDDLLRGFGDRQFSRERLPAYEFHVDGLARRVDLTHVIPELRILDKHRYSSHADYHQAHDSGNWLGAMEAAVRHHAGNPAWARTYRSLAEESVQEIGLESTLDWCRDITDAKARFAAEIAAVQEAVRGWRTSLPGIEADDPEFVTAAVPWPSGC